MKVTCVLKGRIDSNGHQPLQIRVAQGKSRSFHPTGIKVDPELWDAKLRKVKKEHPKAGEYNNDIKRLIIQHQAKALEGAVKKSPKTLVWDYIETCLIQWDKTKKPGTLRQLRSQRDKLNEFAPNLYLHDITVDFLYKYQGYRYSLGNTGNTVWTAFKFLRSIIKKAHAEGLIKDDPFKVFKMPVYRDPQKVYLTKEEIEKVDAFVKDAPSELAFAGTWFLIACYTGLRLSDLRAFEKKKNIVGGRLIVHTVKTSDIVSLPLTERLKGYFERIGYKPLSMTGEHYNRLLKALMLGVGINKKVSSHTARHSAAIMMANAGISIEVTAKILAHQNIKTTSIYYKITNKRIDEELKRLF
jgi:integrase/recombinase XerD